MENQNINIAEKNQLALPNSGGALTLGIISIITFFCCPGIIGLTCSIIALVLSNKAVKEYRSNPNPYTEKSFSNAKTGKICATIGLILSIIMLIASIIFLASGKYAEVMEQYKEMLEKI